jgi:hypothetical protein
VASASRIVETISSRRSARVVSGTRSA